MNTLRPEEQALFSNIRKEQSTNRMVKGALNTAVGLGVAAFGAPVLSSLGQKIMPFLNEYIPQDLAVKGISKLSPKLGEFLKQGEEAGLNVQEGLNFIKERLGSKKPNENRNIIQQYSDKLNQFIENEIKKGRNPLEAAAIARTNKEFDQIIKKMEKDHKTNWSSIIESIYGLGEQAPGGQPQAESGIQQPQQQGAAQPGPGQQALMAILSKINQKIGGMNP